MKLVRYMKEWISHLTLIFAVMLLTFWVTDRFNTAMAFINHDMTKGLMLAFSLCSLAVAIFLLTDRTPYVRKARAVMGIVTLIGAVGLAALLVIDRMAPEQLLFVGDAVKFTLLGVVLCGIVTSVLGIASRRASAPKAE